MPSVSVVIPCYNSGAFLPDAIASIQQDLLSGLCDIIIVDDGSTDDATLKLLAKVEQSGCTVIRQENKGPAAARNTGITSSSSEYILFLDSDNKIRPNFMRKGLDIMQAHTAVGVVYGNVAFFGDTNESRFESQPFDLDKLLQGNFIDMCSMIRRQVWQEVGGLDEARVLVGHEDWDFWIRVGETNWQFRFLNEIVFDYRVREDSLIKQATVPEKHENTLRYLYGKHRQLLLKRHAYLAEQNIYYTHDKKYPLRSFIKYLKNSFAG